MENPRAALVPGLPLEPLAKLQVVEPQQHTLQLPEPQTNRAVSQLYSHQSHSLQRLKVARELNDPKRKAIRNKGAQQFPDFSQVGINYYESTGKSDPFLPSPSPIIETMSTCPIMIGYSTIKKQDMELMTIS